MRVPYARFTAALFGLLLFASGCSTVSVHTDHASGIDFSAYKTFVQAPAPKSAGAQLPGYSEITGDHTEFRIAVMLPNIRDAPRQALIRINAMHFAFIRNEMRVGDLHYFHGLTCLSLDAPAAPVPTTLPSIRNSSSSLRAAAIRYRV